MLNEDWLRQSWDRSQFRISEEKLSVLGEDQLSDVDDRTEVIRFVLQNCPANPVVFPTEQYYYFKFLWKHRQISGNLRFCDSRDGTIHFGYFDEFDSSFMRTGSIKNGINGTVLVKDRDVKLEFQGMERVFVLSRISEQFSEPTLNVGERLVSAVVDESGYCFWLVYNESERLLYYVLNEERMPEEIVAVNLSNFELLIGVRSRFVFFNDMGSDRRILVGVWDENIRKNNYFDGPFDQVPPKLPIKDVLEDVYPYLKVRQVDSFGNFNDEPGSRVAISPYMAYRTVTEIVAAVLSGTDYAENGATRFVEFYSLVREGKGAFVERKDDLPLDIVRDDE